MRQDSRCCAYIAVLPHNSADTYPLMLLKAIQPSVFRIKGSATGVRRRPSCRIRLKKNARNKFTDASVASSGPIVEMHITCYFSSFFERTENTYETWSEFGFRDAPSAASRCVHPSAGGVSQSDERGRAGWTMNEPRPVAKASVNAQVKQDLPSSCQSS